MNQQIVQSAWAATEWGPWKPVIEDAVMRCRSYVLALERAVSGEVSCDHSGFRELAAGLYSAVDEILERCEDYERWKRRWHENVFGG